MPSLATNVAAAAAIAALSTAAGVSADPTPHDLAVAACAALNTSAKLDIMHGFGKIDGYSRNSGCGDLCGRATFRWDNGPQGFGDGTIPGTTTQWPSTLNMASTFDPDLALEWGTAMGEEFWGKGTNIQEGPGINIARIMRNGRNFEYVSGEDPILGSTMVVPIIQGINKNVMSIAKHYILNNQETQRTEVNELIDEKTLMELYGVPFSAAVQESSGVMCAYNRINGTYACENELTMMTMLKGRYNFSGFVVSDWGATHSTNGSLVNGLDIEMPNGHYYTPENIQDAIAEGVVTMDRVDDSCIRALTGWYRVPEDKRYPCRTSPGSSICIDNDVSTPEHKALARKLSAMSTVLLKNDNDLLPISPKPSTPLKILLVGPDATDGCYSGGQGSGGVVTNATVCPLQAFDAVAEASGPRPGANTTTCAPGDRVQGQIIGSGYFSLHASDSADDCCAQCAASDRCRAFTFESNKICYLKDNDDEGEARSTATSGRVNPTSDNMITIDYDDASDIDKTVAAAKEADVVIVFGSAHSGEGHDRDNLTLGGNIDDVIPAVASAAPNKTAVVMTVPGSILTPWRDTVSTILSNGFPGEQVGPAVADIVFGEVSPQAKLPVTFPNKENEQGMTEEQYPGLPNTEFELQCVYSEGQINGYRWYDKNNVAPAFAFGHGLTYGGQFEYSDLVVADRTITFTVKRDSATLSGCDTPQIYFSFPSAEKDSAVPAKQLRHFQKVCHNVTASASFSQTVTYEFGDDAISNWDVDAKKWAVTTGEYGVVVGSSSQDIRLKGSFTI